MEKPFWVFMLSFYSLITQVSHFSTPHLTSIPPFPLFPSWAKYLEHSQFEELRSKTHSTSSQASAYPGYITHSPKIYLINSLIFKTIRSLRLDLIYSWFQLKWVIFFINFLKGLLTNLIFVYLAYLFSAKGPLEVC